MVSRFFKILNRDVATMNQAALVLAIFSLASQLMGLLRDRLLASLVGPSAGLDVYYAAFRIPDFIYNSVAVLFSVTVIIPFITHYLNEDKDGKNISIKKFFDNIFSVYLVGMSAVALIVFLLMPYLTKLTAPGFNLVQNHNLILYSRIMLLSPFLMGLASLLGSFAQVKKKFFAFALAPLFYNLGILAGIILLRPIFGILGVVLGVVIGAALYLLVQLPTLVSLQKIPSLTRNIDWKIISQVIKLSLPRTLASSLSNLTFILISAIASLLVAGSISIFQFAYNIETTPLIIIGISYATAAFPTMNKLFIDKKIEEFSDLIQRATRNIFFLSVPAALFLVVLRAQVVRVLLGTGKFSWNDTRLVAASLALFALSVTAQCMVLLMVRAFYAMSDTKTPLKINIFALLTTMVSAGILLFFYRESMVFKEFLDSLLRLDGVIDGSVVLLPLAFSIGQILNACILWRFFQKRIKRTRYQIQKLNKIFFQTISASILAAFVVYVMLSLSGNFINQDRFLGVFVQGSVAGLVGIAVYGFILMILKNEDVYLFIETLKSRFWKQKPLAVEQRDL